MSTEPFLRFIELKKDVAGRRLLDIASLSLSQGRCLLLSGDNGAGKTTLLKIIAGLESAGAAAVYYQGRRRSLRGARRLYRRDVVYLHQAPYMFDRSVAENVGYGLRHRGISRARQQAIIDEALDWAGLSALAARNARRLSGGEKQRVALARARVLSPRLLLLDEPLSSMDHASRERTYFLIQRLKNEHIGVVVTSHELQRLRSLSDEHVRLQNGRLYGQDPPASDPRRGGDGRGAAPDRGLAPVPLRPTLSIWTDANNDDRRRP